MKMKKIVVMSDSHGYHQMINRVKELEPDGDYYVHCGDSEAETYMMQDWLCVKGNNDWYSDFPNQIKFKVEALKEGDQVALVGFGTFAVRERASRSGRNPQTGATIEIAACKQPAFKAGKALKDAVN